jgi:hypothetical protein
LSAAEHWSGGEVPPPGSDLVIHNKGVLQNASWQAASLRLDKAGLFLKSGTLDVKDGIALQQATIPIQRRGALRAGGAIEVFHDSHLVVFGDALGVEAGCLSFFAGCTLRYKFFGQNQVQHIAGN